jgi:hypothetical protein
VVCCVFVRSSCLSPSPIRSFPSRNGHPPQARVKAVPLLLPLQRPTTRRRSQLPVQSSSAGAPRSRHSRPRSPSLQPTIPTQRQVASSGSTLTCQGAVQLWRIPPFLLAVLNGGRIYTLRA